MDSPRPVAMRMLAGLPRYASGRIDRAMSRWSVDPAAIRANSIWAWMLAFGSVMAISVLMLRSPFR